MEEQREGSVLRIEDALRPLNVPVVSGGDTLKNAGDTVAAAHAPAFLVKLRDGSWYAMTAEELSDISETAGSDTVIERALKLDRTPILFPDLPLDSTFRHFPRWPLLPVLNRASKSTLEGILTLEDVLTRYRHQ
jgi:CIC family chloride channel protein